MKRIVETYIFDPEMNVGKMIFLTGPRQVGKTTFAKNWLSSLGFEEMYFNWDDPAVMREYTRNPMYFKNAIDGSFKGTPVPVVFDEIHKHSNWRNILKGIFDTNRDRMQLLVTGSARLGMYRKSGDSLIGRYFSYQMLPLGLPEAVDDFSYVLQDSSSFAAADSFVGHVRKTSVANAADALQSLLAYSGYPEPFLKGSVRFHTRWQREYRTLLAKEDIRDLSRIADIRGIEQLVELLPAKVGSPLSLNSLREDLGHHHETIKNWIEVLKELYLVFTIRPWHRNITRSIKKEVKLYFLDWTNVPDTGYRFENIVALSLARMAARFTEMGLGAFEIMYLRDKDKREVDFVLVKDNEPVALFEAKETAKEISQVGKHFSAKLGIPFYQIVRHSDSVETFPGGHILPAVNFLLSIG